MCLLVGCFGVGPGVRGCVVGAVAPLLCWNDVEGFFKVGNSFAGLIECAFFDLMGEVG